MAREKEEKTIKVPRFEESGGFYVTPQRSELMSKIKGRNTKPERLFRKELYRRGVRYRVNFKKLPGKPDISNVSRKFVVFIDGEFWHGYDWDTKKEKIKKNRGFWIPKIERNMQRDRQNNQILEAMGFKVFRFWVRQVNNQLDECVNEVVEYVQPIS